MCGIAGVLGPPDDRPETVAAREAQARAMIERLAHRGPDGIRVETVGGSALAHARLSIIDLEGGWQPLHAVGSTVIGNGEIYNYVELIEEFGLQDKLKTGSDFEPLLHLYALEGEKAFTRLRGMYAFCLIGGDGRTWLVRDPFGIKPLYTFATHEEVRFASEPRAFVALGPRRDALRLLTEHREEVLALGYRLRWDTSASLGTGALWPGEVHEITATEDRDGSTSLLYAYPPWSPFLPLIPAEAGTQALAAAPSLGRTRNPAGPPLKPGSPLPRG